MFDEIISRKNTFSTQWDFIADRFKKSDLLPFTIADMDFRSPEGILKSFRDRVDHGIFGSARWKNEEFLGSITSWYQRRFDYKINKDWISFSAGVVYGIGTLLQVLNPNKENVLMFSPVYEGFLEIIAGKKYPLLSVKITENIENSDFEEKIAKSKVLIMCNPNNPSGKLWNHSELSYIVNICKKHNVYIISDDVFMDLVHKPHKFIPILKVAEELDYLDNTNIVTAPAKTFNVVGIGGGYTLIPNNSIREKFCCKIADEDSLSAPNIFSVLSIVAGYNHCEDWLDKVIPYCYNNLQEVSNFLNNNIPELTMEIPKSTYMAWINCSKLNLTSDEIQNRLINKGGVAIMDGRNYGEDIPYLRMNVGCPLSKVQEGLKRIKLSFS